jgi:hypothetical protein
MKQIREGGRVKRLDAVTVVLDGEEAGVRAQLARSARELRSLCYRLLGVQASLAAPWAETVQEVDYPDQELAFPAEARRTLACVVADQIAPAIRALEDLAEYRPRPEEDAHGPA